MNPVVPLIKSRLKLLEAERRKLDAVLNERSIEEYCDKAKLFNAEKDIDRKMKLAGEMQALLKRGETWVQRSKKANDRKIEVVSEIRELQNRLFFEESR